MEENKVYDIDTILDMLNGLDNDIETQERGIEEGKKFEILRLLSSHIAEEEESPYGTIVQEYCQVKAIRS